jgi:hypothetical protein
MDINEQVRLEADRLMRMLGCDWEDSLVQKKRQVGGVKVVVIRQSDKSSLARFVWDDGRVFGDTP